MKGAASLHIAKPIVNAIYAFCYFSGLTGMAYWFGRNKQTVITYHNIIEDELFDNTLHLGVSNRVCEFRKQMEVINARFPITTDLGVPGTCVITFDDGYRNNYSIACPVLDEFKAKAYFFIPVSMISGDEILWVDKVLLWLSYAPYGQYVLSEDIVIVIDDEESRLHAWQKLWAELKKNYSFRNELTAHLNSLYPFNQLNITPKLFNTRFGKITVVEIDEMKKHGHKIGAHSECHDVLSRLPEGELLNDFRVCEAYLEGYYNTNVYSYPFGGMDEVSDKVIAACRKSKFSAAFLNFPIQNNRSQYEIGRIPLSDVSNVFAIEAKLSGLESFLKKLLGKKVSS